MAVSSICERNEMTLRAVRILLILAAVFLIVEGIVSILVFWGQPTLFQAARGLRIAIGVFMILLRCLHYI